VIITTVNQVIMTSVKSLGTIGSAASLVTETPYSASAFNPNAYFKNKLTSVR